MRMRPRRCGIAVALVAASFLAAGSAQTDVAAATRAHPVIVRVSVNNHERQADDDSFRPFLSATGRYVAFTSGASGLVPGDTNGVADVFVRDRRRGTTERVSVSSSGTEARDFGCSGVGISANGRY